MSLGLLCIPHLPYVELLQGCVILGLLVSTPMGGVVSGLCVFDLTRNFYESIFNYSI